MIGVRADGTKELVALTDGHRESSESWADLLRDCKRRGMAAPVLAIGDGALGFWAALRDVFPATREQGGWFHKITDDLDVLLAFYDYPAEHWATCVPPTRSSRPWPPSAFGSGSPRARIAGGRRGDGVRRS